MKHFFYKEQLICISFILVLFAGCNNRSSSLKQSLTLAGENRAELEKVLAHYKNEPLKLKAAEFLIENMPGHYSYKNQDWLNAYYHEISDSVSLDYDNKTNQLIIENISKKYQGEKISELVLDIRVLTADYLIDNIEKSFAVWPGEWATHVLFDDFCEYILPYKGVELQPLDNWREYTYDMLSADLNTLPYCDLYKNLAVQAATSINKEIIKLQQQELPPGGLHSIPVKDVRTLVGMPFGSCDNYTVVALAVMRSKGIPVMEDYTPQWPFQAGQHSWSILLDNYGKNVVFSPGSSNPGEPHKPDEKMAKVFRHTYAINREILAMRSAEKHIPPTLASSFIKDVTGEYMSVIDVEIEIPPEWKNKHKYAYLAVFDNQNWIPIQYGKVSGKKVKFKQMGKMCMYLPVFYDESGVKPFAAPFHIACDGHGELFLDTLQSKYRYWRYYSADAQYNNMAEMYFYEDEDMPPVYSNIIGSNGSVSNKKRDEKTAVFDTDIKLIYKNAPSKTVYWIRNLSRGRDERIFTYENGKQVF